jgi:hypothetical protein
MSSAQRFAGQPEKVVHPEQWVSERICIFGQDRDGPLTLMQDLQR